MSFTLLSEFRKMPKDDMTSGCKLVLYYLCDLANEQTRIAFPSVETIGKEVGLSTKQARRYTHELEKRGWVKIVANRLGGDKGKSCRYKITLPPIKKKTAFIKTENYTTPTQAPNPSHTGAVTPPPDGSLTVVKPYITNIDLNKKFGFGWSKNPDTAYQAGLAIGIQARPGEDTYAFVNRIYAALNKHKSAYA
jgi:hypothetical protein